MKTAFQQKKQEIIAKERKERQAAEWDKRLLSLSNQITSLKDEALRLERINVQVTTENKKLKKLANFEPEITSLYTDAKKQIKILSKENEELKEQLEQLKAVKSDNTTEKLPEEVQFKDVMIKVLTILQCILNETHTCSQAHPHCPQDLKQHQQRYLLLHL
jgi:hypothetical protein